MSNARGLLLGTFLMAAPVQAGEVKAAPVDGAAKVENVQALSIEKLYAHIHAYLVEANVEQGFTRAESEAGANETVKNFKAEFPKLDLDKNVIAPGDALFHYTPNEQSISVAVITPDNAEQLFELLAGASNELGKNPDLAMFMILSDEAGMTTARGQKQAAAQPPAQRLEF